MNHWPHQSEVDAFYGDPRGNGDDPNAAWVEANIVRVLPPWKLVTAWNFQPVTKGVTIHTKCKASLERIFAAIWRASGENPAKIQEWGMHLYAGGFNFRMMRGSTRLSMHSWGCAIDFDSARNTFGDRTPNFENVPQVLDAFGEEEWVWGGRWSKPDGMHWQAAAI